MDEEWGMAVLGVSQREPALGKSVEGSTSPLMTPKCLLIYRPSLAALNPFLSPWPTWLPKLTIKWSRPLLVSFLFHLPRISLYSKLLFEGDSDRQYRIDRERLITKLKLNHNKTDGTLTGKQSFFLSTDNEYINPKLASSWLPPKYEGKRSVSIFCPLSLWLPFSFFILYQLSFFLL